MDKKFFNQKNIEEEATVFSALADQTRLKLIKLLCSQHLPNDLCVNALASLLGVSQSAISQHLRILKSIGLVKGERKGYHIHYHINPEAIKSLRQLISATLNIEESNEDKLCNNCNKDSKQNYSTDQLHSTAPAEKRGKYDR